MPYKRPAEYYRKRREEYARLKHSITEEQRERHRAAHKRWYEKNKQKRNAQTRALYQANKEEYYARHRKNLMTKLEAKAGRPKPTRCEVCGDDKARIEFDHCHRSGVFRGWLCTHCNVILGHARDDPERLRKLIEYLERTIVHGAPMSVASARC